MGFEPEKTACAVISAVCFAACTNLFVLFVIRMIRRGLYEPPSYHADDRT